MTAPRIHCSKLGIEAEALAQPPFPGELGKRIQQHISKPAWQGWLKHQTLLINENRLNACDPETRKKLRDNMISYLFDDDTLEQPEGYTPVAPPQ